MAPTPPAAPARPWTRTTRALLGAAVLGCAPLLGLALAAAPAQAMPACVQTVKPALSPATCEGTVAEVTVPPGEAVNFEARFENTLENPEPGKLGCREGTHEGHAVVECPDRVEWSFGDGTPPVTQTVWVNTDPSQVYVATAAHTYAEAGQSYTVKVMVTDPTGAGTSREAELKVKTGPALITTLIASQPFPTLGEAVTFTAEQEAPFVKPLTYEVALDGNPLRTVEINEGKPARYSFSEGFSTLGAHTVTVKAHDSTTPTALKGEAQARVEVVPRLGGTLSPNAPQVEAGASLTLSAEATGGRPPYSYAWSADGTPFAGSGAHVTAPFTGSVGEHRFAVSVGDSARPPHTETLEGHATVTPAYPPLTGSIAPGGTVVLQSALSTVTFTASVAGGLAPYTYFWKIEPQYFPTSPPFESTGSSPTFSHSFDFLAESLQPYVVTLIAQDARGVTVTLHDTVAFQMCPYEAEVGLVQVVNANGGCLKQGTGEEGAKTWSTEEEVKVNGLPIKPAHGHPLVLTAPTKAHPGGQIAAGGIDLSLKFPGLEVTLLKEATLSWDLPSGRSQEETLASMSVAPGTTSKLFGMSIGGSVHVNAGVDARNGEHYLAFGLNIELPKLFKSGPGKQAGGVTAEGAMRVDARGYHFDGLHLELKEAWLGALQVEDICLAYIPAGSQAPVAECPAPEVEGKPFIECNHSAAYSRWSGTAALVLPTPSKPKLAIFGGLSGGSISYFGGILEVKPGMPIVDDVYLDRVGIGICLQPPPFKLKGEVGVDALPVGTKPTLQVNGHFLFEDSYTDAAGTYHPWSVELGGSVELYEQQVGRGHVTVDGNGDLELGLYAELHLFHLIEVEGRIEGWLEPAQRLFEISGGVHACVAGLLCGDAEGEISSTGVAGCIFTEILGHRYGAGFGHRWDEGHHVHLLGSSCDFGEFEATRAALIAAAGTAGHVRVGPHVNAIVLRIAGAGAPPAVVLRGPHGERIAAPASGGARGHGYIAIANPTEDATDVLLARPAAGTWRVQSVAPGARITSITTSHYLGHPSGHARVGRGRHGTRLLTGRINLPAGERVRLGEEGRQVARTVHVGLRPCGHRGGERLLCVRAPLRPAPGVAGRRRIVAVVSRDGLPVGHFVLATFHVAATALPSRPRVRLERHGSRVTVAWSRAANASRYTISVTTSGGRKLAFNPQPGCRRLVVGGIGRRARVTAQVAGVRYDLAAGRFARATLAPGKRHAGARKRLRGRRCP